jgi:hypothetical protein
MVDTGIYVGKTNLVLQDFKVLRNLGARAKHWGVSELTFPRGIERVPERVVGLGFCRRQLHIRVSDRSSLLRCME